MQVNQTLAKEEVFWVQRVFFLFKHKVYFRKCSSPPMSYGCPMPDLHMHENILSVPMGCEVGVDQSSWHAHHDVPNLLRDLWKSSVRNYTARGGVHAPHLAHRTSVRDTHRTSDGRTERDTLKSTYVKQLPLFGKATEVATRNCPAGQ